MGERTTDALGEALERIAELEAAIRAHRDRTGHRLCWRDDQTLWAVLREGLPDPELPPHREFVLGCLRYAERLYGAGEAKIPDGIEYEALSTLFDPVPVGFSAPLIRIRKVGPDILEFEQS